MKKFIGYILLTLVLVSCGAESGHFRISGRLRNFNQGEFYVYSTDGAIPGLDTITVTQFAQLYGHDAEYAGAINILSTLLCLATMPLFVWLYGL